MDTTNLISWLTFDESTTFDWCGNEWTLNGTLNVDSTNAISGNSLQLTGNGDTNYLQLDGIALGGRDFTIHAYVYSDPTNTGNTYNWARFFAIYNPNNMSRCRISMQATKFEINGSTTGSITRGTRHHVAIVYLHSTSTLLTFCDGVKVGTKSVTFAAGVLSRIYIGKSEWSGYSTLTGTVDEFIVYDGIALWTENFTPPTADFYSVSEVKFKPEVFMSWLPTGEINFKPEVFMSWIPHGEINFKPEIFATLISEDILCEFNADLRRKLVNSVEFNADLKRTLIASVDFNADLRRSLANTVDLSADLRRKLVNRVEFSVDLKRTIIAPVEFTADLRRRVRASLTGGRMLSRVSPIYDASTFMQHFFNALGAEWEPIRQYFLTLREQKFIQTVDWGIEYLEHKYSIVPDKTLTLAERRARLGIKAFNKRPLNPAVLEKYARDVFGLEVYLDESDAGYIWIIATELTQIGYEGFMKFLVQEKPAHLALAFLLYFSEYIGYKIGDDLPKLHVGLVQVTSGVGKIKLPRPKNQHVDLYAGLAQITHGKATINLPRPKTQLINFSAGCALAVTGRIYIRSSYNALEAS